MGSQRVGYDLVTKQQQQQQQQQWQQGFALVKARIKCVQSLNKDLGTIKYSSLQLYPTKDTRTQQSVTNLWVEFQVNFLEIFDVLSASILRVVQNSTFPIFVFPEEKWVFFPRYLFPTVRDPSWVDILHKCNPEWLCIYEKWNDLSFQWKHLLPY